MKYSDSELERALFNLPLEEAPDGMRASILTQTVYRRHALPAVKPWETWLIGGCLAAIAWLMVLVLREGFTPVVSALNSIGDVILYVMSQPSTILWIAVGGAASIWLSHFTPVFAPSKPAVRR
jgi:heme O synthase-like polyprenyltransferase